MAPTTPTPGSGGAGGNANTIQLTIAIDAKTGLLTIQQVTTGVKKMGTETATAGEAAQHAGDRARSSSDGWLKLYAQTELVARGLHMMEGFLKDTLVASTLVAARTEVLNTTLAITAKNMNYTTGAAQAQVDAIRKMNITHQDAINLTLGFMRAQLDLAKATNLARAAQEFAVITGENSSAVASHLTEAIQTQNVWMLRQYGMVVYLDQVLEQYANRLNRTADSLSTTERSQAMLNYILAQSGKITGAYIASMDDAGKKMTSLVRVFQDAREHIGERFLPLLGKVVDTLYNLGESISRLPGWFIDVVGAITLFITAAGALTVAIMGIAKAWSLVRAAALAAAGAEAAAGSTGAVSGILALIAAQPEIAIIVGLLAAGAAIYAVWGARAENHYKSVVAASDALAGQVAQMENVKKEYADINTLQQKALAGDVTQRELHAYQSLTTEQNKQLAILDRKIEAQNRMNALEENAKAVGLELIKISTDNQGVTHRVIDLQKLNDLEVKQKQDLLTEQHEMEDIVKQRRDTVALIVKQIEHYKEWAQLHQLDKTDQAAYNDGLHKGNEEWYKANKELQQAAQELDVIKSKATGLQLLPLTLTQTVNSLQTALGLYQQMQTAQLQGVKNLDGARQMVGNLVTGTSQLVDNVKNAVQATLEQQRANKNLTDDEKARLALMEQAGPKIVQVFEDAYAKNEKAINGAKTQMGQLTAAADAAAEAIAKGGKDLVSFTKDANTPMSELVQSVLGLQVGLKQNAQQLLVMNANAAAAIPQLQQRVAQAQDQTIAAQETQAKLQTEINEKLKDSMVSQFAVSTTNKSLVPVYKQLLELAIQTEEKHAKEVRDRQQILELAQLQLGVEQAVAEAFGNTAQQQEEILKRQTQIQETELRTRLDKEHGLTEALEKLWDAYYLRLYAVWKRQQDLMRQQELEDVRTRQQTLEANQPEAGATDAQIKAMEDLHRREGELALEQYQKTEEFINLEKTDSVKAWQYLHDKREQLDADNAAFARNLENQTADLRMQIADRVATFMGQIHDKNNKAGQIDLQTQHQIRAVQMEITQLARLDTNIAAHKDEILEKITAELLKQAALQKQEQALENAKTIVQNPASSHQQVADAIKVETDAWKQAREQLQAAQDAYDGTAESAQRLVTAMQKVADTTITMSDVFKAWLNGVPVDKMAALQAGLNEIGTAATQAFAALGSGQSVKSVFKKMIAGELQEMSQYAMQKSIFHAMAGAADLATPYTAPMATGEFISAGLWAAAAAALGIAGGALSGGGGAGGSGGAGSKGSTVQTPEPVATRTAMEDQIIKLNGNLVVNNRVVQYAGSQYNQLGATMFQLTHSINMLANSNDNAAKNMSDTLANQLAQATQGGFQSVQMANLITGLNSFVNLTDKKQSTDSGVLQGINVSLLETKSILQENASNMRSLPTAIADNLSSNLNSVQKVQDDRSTTMIDIARRQLIELQKANDKDPMVAVDASTYLDGNALSSLATNGFVKNLSTYSRAVTSAAASGLGLNSSRQQMARSLRNGGV
jgi:hypothetical protein